MKGPQLDKDQKKKLDQYIEKDAGTRRQLEGLLKWLAIILSVGMVFIYLYSAGFQPFAPQYHRGIYVLITFLLIFLLVPITSKYRHRPIPTIYSFIFFIVSLVTISYWILEYKDLVERAGDYTDLDYYMSIAGIIVSLEMARRVLGWSLPIIGIAMLLFAYFGRYMPDAFQHGGFTIREISTFIFISQNGIFGIMANVLATYVILFIFFGAFLERSGVTNFFIDLAMAAAGRQVGGPAKVSVIASAFFGSISGSAIANTVSTGIFTIPLMRKAGFRPHVAGAIEPSASIAGMFLPPVMGAGGFLMAEYTAIDYSTIMVIAIFPALMYIWGVFSMIHFEAKKQNLPLPDPSEIPSPRDVLADRWYLGLPLIVVAWVMMVGSVAGAAFYGVVTTLIVYFVDKAKKLGKRATVYAMYIILLGLAINIALAIVKKSMGDPFLDTTMMKVYSLHPNLYLLTATGIAVIIFFIQKGTIGELGTIFKEILNIIWVASKKGGDNTLVIGATLGVIGIIVGVVELTGIGLQMSSIIIDLANGISDSPVFVSLANLLGIGPEVFVHAIKIFITVIFIALASLVLGMGVPVTAAYMITAVLVVSALTDLGVSLLAAHMIVYWFSQDSNITPPVCIAAYAGAAIANADPWKTGWTSFKYAKMLYVVPILFAYIPAMTLDDSVGNILVAFVSIFLGTVAFSSLTMFFVYRRTLWVEWVLLIPTTILLFLPTWETTALGVILFSLLYFFQMKTPHLKTA